MHDAATVSVNGPGERGARPSRHSAAPSALDVRQTTRRHGLRQVHRRMILDAIRRTGPLSRKDLAERLDIRPNTVTVHVNTLLEKKLLAEVAVVSTPTGRRPVLLDISADRACVAAAALRDDSVDLMVTDLKGGVLAQTAFPCRMTTRARFFRDLGRGLEEILSLTGRRRKHLRGLGLAAPGLVDYKSGRAISYSHFEWWRDLPLAATVGQSLGIPTTVENDTRALAFAEKWFGPLRDAQSLLVVELSQGVGSALLVDGDLFRGATGGAGELGHLTIDPNGPRCACGSAGCLETFASRKAFLSAYKRHGGNADPSRDERALLRRIASELAEGSASARAAVAEVGRALGVGLAGAINIIDPESIVLCGDLAVLGKPLAEAARPTIATCALRETAKDIDIFVSSVGEHAAALGAAAVAIERLFRDA